VSGKKEANKVITDATFTEEVLEKASTLYGKELKITRLNVDENAQRCRHLDFKAFQHLVFFKESKLMNRIIGSVSKDALKRHGDRLLEIQPA
jgi:thioredoxin-like negative regulator of GroEL